jgi:CubicO group peptidase (beta-lactamase class C family)
MKYYIKIVFIFLFLSAKVYAQDTGHEARLKVVSSFVEGYNAQNYKALKKSWFWLGKLLVTKKALKKEFLPFYNNYGKATIDTITYTSRYEYVAKLKMEKKPEEQVFLKFIFSDRNKIEGAGFSYPTLIYKKCRQPMPINRQEFSSRVDSLVKRKYIKNKADPFNGSVMVMDEGVAIYQKNFGYADMERLSSLNDSTLYELASCSKQFTATAIMILAEQGKLKLTDTLQKFIPSFPYQHITIENLLTHTSGLPSYEALLAKVWDKTKFATNTDVVNLLKLYKPQILFNPNEQFVYSNTGYVLLAYIIETISNMSYQQFLDSTIFKPLHMKRSRVYNTRRSVNEVIDNYAYGYIYSSKLENYILPDSIEKYKMVIYQDVVSGDGSVNSSTQDLILWQRELMNPTLLSKQTLAKAFQRHQLNNGAEVNYGYGFFLSGGGSAETLIYHTGGWPGYLCIIMLFPESKKSVIVLSNNSSDYFMNIADDISAILLGN